MVFVGGGKEQLSERYFIAMARGSYRQPKSVGERKSCVFTVSWLSFHVMFVEQHSSSNLSVFSVISSNLSVFSNL